MLNSNHSLLLDDNTVFDFSNVLLGDMEESTSPDPQEGTVGDIPTELAQERQSNTSTATQVYLKFILST